MSADDLPDFTKMMTGPPQEGLKIITEDLIKRLKRQGLKEQSVEGITVAMRIAFKLGENSGALRVGVQE
jgi:predicted metal-dependent phosphotriesterase family hydrolase